KMARGLLAEERGSAERESVEREREGHPEIARGVPQAGQRPRAGPVQAVASWRRSDVAARGAAGRRPRRLSSGTVGAAAQGIGSVGRIGYKPLASGVQRSASEAPLPF